MKKAGIKKSSSVNGQTKAQKKNVNSTDTKKRKIEDYFKPLIPGSGSKIGGKERKLSENQSDVKSDVGGTSAKVVAKKEHNDTVSVTNSSVNADVSESKPGVKTDIVGKSTEIVGKKEHDTVGVSNSSGNPDVSESKSNAKSGVKGKSEEIVVKEDHEDTVAVSSSSIRNDNFEGKPAAAKPVLDVNSGNSKEVAVSDSSKIGSGEKPDSAVNDDKKPFVFKKPLFNMGLMNKLKQELNKSISLKTDLASKQKSPAEKEEDNKKVPENESDECELVDLVKEEEKSNVKNGSFKCSKCSEVFSEKKERDKHRRKCSATAGAKEGDGGSGNRTASEDYKCAICNKKQKSKFLLAAHMLCHTSETVACEECGELFADNESLLDHIELHEIQMEQDESKSKENHENPPAEGTGYVCTICNRKFEVEFAYSVHKRFHSM